MNRTLLVTASMLAAGWMTFACSGDEDGAAPPTGGTEDAGDGDQADGGNEDAPAPGNGRCKGPEATPIGAFGPKAMRLQQTTDALVVWDIGAGDASASVGKTGAIVRLAKAGGEPSELYKPSNNAHKVLDVLADGDDVFTTEFDGSASPSTNGKLLRIPAGGGAAVEIAQLPLNSDDFGNLVAVDATSVFYMANQSLYRAPRAGGSAPVAIATLGVEAIAGQVIGADLVLTQKLAGSTVWRVPRAATSPADAMKLTDENNCLGDLLAVTDGYYCASTLSVAKLDANFVVGETVYSLLNSGDPGALPRFAGIDGDKVLFGAKASANAPGPFRRLTIGETTSEVIACGIGSWLDAVFDASAVYLLQEQAGETTPTQVVKFTR